MITLRNLQLRRGAKIVLDGVNVNVNPGEKVGLEPSGEQREQAGLARAVAPDQAHLLAGIDVDVDAVEDDLGPSAQLQVA